MNVPKNTALTGKRKKGDWPSKEYNVEVKVIIEIQKNERYSYSTRGIWIYIINPSYLSRWWGYFNAYHHDLWESKILADSLWISAHERCMKSPSLPQAKDEM